MGHAEPMNYYIRFFAICLAVVLTIAGLLLFGPRAAPITLVAQAPNGEEVAAGAAIRLTFSRPVERRSAELGFSVSPPLPGRFIWQEQTLTFQPAQPLAADTEYTVTIAAGLRDEQGRANANPLSWRFRTRGPRLLALRTTESGGSAIWLVRPDGGDPREIHVSPAGISDMIVSPNGLGLIYVEPRGLQRSALMLLDLESAQARPLVDDEGASAATPSWAPIGDFIAYERRALVSGALGVPRIWLAQPDGTLLGPLFAGDGSDISYAPAWSPDSNSLAFLDGVSQELKVYSFFSDTVRTLAARSGERPGWAPDGSALIFSSVEVGEQGPTLRIRVVGVEEGAAQRDLTDGAGAELSPAISPDGTMVAFVRREPGGAGSGIWVVPTAGGAARRLSQPGPHQDTQPHWSPDGARIAFVRSSAAGPLRSDAVVVNLADGAETVVLSDVAQVLWAP